MITSVIIDNELHSQENLKTLIDLNFKNQIHLHGSADNLNDGEQLISLFHPTIVFLDISLPDGDGFKLLEKYDNEVPFEVVVISDNKEHAFNAIKNNVLEYLIKPVSTEDLLHVVSKLEKKLNNKHSSGHVLFSNAIEKINKIPLITLYGIKLIDAATFLFAKAEGAYTIVTTTDGEKITISKSMKEFENMTSQYQFFRTHKSYIINLQHVIEFIRKDDFFVVIRNNIKIPLSIRKKDEFLQKIM